MTTRQITSGTRSSKAAWMMALAIAGVTALAVVAVGIDTWRDARPQAVTRQMDAPIQSGPTSVRSDVGSTPSRAPIETVYYLVSSQEEAALLRELVASYGAPPEVGQPLLMALVVVDGTNSLAPVEVLPLPPHSRIIDMRRPAAADTGS